MNLDLPALSLPMLEPPLRLGLVFFDEEDVRALRAIVNWAASKQLPWTLVDERPFHALLMAHGPRSHDPKDVAIFRLGADAHAAASKLYGDAMPPMALRKPLQPMHVRIVLEMAAASLIPDYVDRLSPQTRVGGGASIAGQWDLNANFPEPAFVHSGLKAGVSR